MIARQVGRLHASGNFKEPNDETDLQVGYVNLWSALIYAFEVILSSSEAIQIRHTAAVPRPKS